MTDFFDTPVAKQDIDVPKVDEKDVPDDDDIEALFSNIVPGTDLRGDDKKPVKVEDIIDVDAMRENMNDVQDVSTSQFVSNSGKLVEGTRNINEKTLIALERSEEIEAELVRQNGRFLEGSDNAKIGVTIDGGLATQQYENAPMMFAEPPKGYISEGVNTFDPNLPDHIFDPGADAQKQEDVKQIETYEPNDPRSPSFIACVNNTCAYRENCLRYRMKNKVTNKFPFFPEECRIDGTFISLDDTDFTAYDSMNTLESNVTPSI